MNCKESLPLLGEESPRLRDFLGILAWRVLYFRKVELGSGHNMEVGLQAFHKERHPGDTSLRLFHDPVLAALQVQDRQPTHRTTLHPKRVRILLP